LPLGGGWAGHAPPVYAVAKSAGGRQWLGTPAAALLRGSSAAVSTASPRVVSAPIPELSRRPLPLPILRRSPRPLPASAAAVASAVSTAVAVAASYSAAAEPLWLVRRPCTRDSAPALASGTPRSRSGGAIGRGGGRGRAAAETRGGHGVRGGGCGDGQCWLDVGSASWASGSGCDVSLIMSKTDMPPLLLLPSPSSEAPVFVSATPRAMLTARAGDGSSTVAVAASGSRGMSTWL
jgi:hypothetical protein